jgi:hypothetical protein
LLIAIEKKQADATLAMILIWAGTENSRIAISGYKIR